MKLSSLLLILIIFNPALYAQGYLHCDGKKIVNRHADEIILKGINLGGWMLQEPYLIEFPANAQNQIRVKIETLIGKANTDTFYDVYRANFIRKKDIDSLAAWGFNSIRLPMHYNLFISPGDSNIFIEKGFTMIDSLLSWCETNHIYLILDMHAAPGGQGGDTAISDVVKDQPLLWQSAGNKTKTVMLWRKLAERYKDKQWIGGYDLINESNYSFNQSGENTTDLKSLYVRITDTIREVDSTHILFIEGNWFATDFNAITPPWNSNMVYSFHKYWNSNNDLNAYLWLRNNYNVPLWLGESGENSNTWYADCINLVQNINKIGWAWWPMKKFNCNGLMTATKPPAYQILLDYWNNIGHKPDIAFARNALIQLAENFKIENCKINYNVIQAMMELPGITNTKPFKQHSIPGTIFASDYDIGRNNYAYFDAKAETLSFDNKGGNEGGEYRNDGVDIESCKDTLDITNGYNVGWTESSEWMNYTFECSQAGYYIAELRIAGQNGGTIVLKIDNNPVSSDIVIPSTGGWQNWQTVSVKGIEVPAGKHVLQVYIANGSVNLSYLKFKSVLDNIKNTLLNSAEEIIVYPNPVKDILNLELPLSNYNKLNIEISDLLGRKAIFHTSEIISNKLILNVNDLIPGTYLLTITLRNKVLSKLFIKD